MFSRTSADVKIVKKIVDMGYSAGCGKAEQGKGSSLQNGFFKFHALKNGFRSSKSDKHVLVLSPVFAGQVYS